MLNRGVKRLALFSIVLYIFLSYSTYTAADIFAERIIKHNVLSAMTLDFIPTSSFNGGVVTSMFHSLGFEPGGFDLGAVRIRRTTFNGFKYRLKAVQTNGETAFCNALNLEVLNRSFVKLYSGRVMDVSLKSVISSDSPENWIFSVGLDEKDGALKNKICEFGFDFRTYRDNPDEQGGIFAERKISNVISSGNW